MNTLRKVFSFKSWAAFLTAPRYRTLHAIIITIALITHLSLHYATYIPALREPMANLPYVKLHVLHEAEFIMIIFYAAVVFRLTGGLIAVGLSAVSSIPFVLTPYIFGRAPRPGEIRDLAIQVAFILTMGAAISLLYESIARERDRRLELAEHLEAANRQLAALNHTIQANINRIYGDLRTTLVEQQKQLHTLPPGAMERFARFIQRVEEITGRS